MNGNSLPRKDHVSFWDALIVQAAQSADVLYSDDLSSGQDDGQVVVINPLTDTFVLPS